MLLLKNLEITKSSKSYWMIHIENNEILNELKDQFIVDIDNNIVKVKHDWCKGIVFAAIMNIMK